MPVDELDPCLITEVPKSFVHVLTHVTLRAAIPREEFCTHVSRQLCKKSHGSAFAEYLFAT